MCEKVYQTSDGQSWVIRDGVAVPAGTPRQYYVLIAEYGEYENATRKVVGVFLSEDEARAAIPKVKEVGERQWAIYKDHEKRQKEYLTRFEPRKFHAAFPPLYTNEQYVEAEAACGPTPDISIAAISDDAEWVVECFNLNEIGEQK